MDGLEKIRKYITYLSHNERIQKTLKIYYMISIDFCNINFRTFLRARFYLSSLDKRKRKWAKKWFKKHPTLYKYIDPDKVRAMFGN